MDNKKKDGADWDTPIGAFKSLYIVSNSNACKYLCSFVFNPLLTNLSLNQISLVYFPFADFIHTI